MRVTKALADGSVTTVKLASSCLTKEKIAANLLYAIGSDIVAASNDAVKAAKYPASGGYGISKEIKSRFPISLTLRISFEMKNDSGGQPTYGKIYIDGVAAGTERYTTSASYQTYTEDIVVPAGALIQLYSYNDTASSLRNFRVLSSYDFQLSALAFVNTVV